MRARDVGAEGSIKNTCLGATVSFYTRGFFHQSIRCKNSVSTYLWAPTETGMFHEIVCNNASASFGKRTSNRGARRITEFAF